MRVGGAGPHPLAAAMGAFAVLGAPTIHRQQTGEGQYIDLSLAEAPLCGIPEALMDYAMNRRVPPRWGNRDEIMAPHGCYPCRGDDEWIAIAVRDEADWAALRRVMGDPPWVQDGQRFAGAFLPPAVPG